MYASLFPPVCSVVISVSVLNGLHVCYQCGLHSFVFSLSYSLLPLFLYELLSTSRTVYYSKSSKRNFSSLTLEMCASARFQHRPRHRCPANTAEVRHSTLAHSLAQSPTYPPTHSHPPTHLVVIPTNMTLLALVLMLTLLPRESEANPCKVIPCLASYHSSFLNPVSSFFSVTSPVTFIPTSTPHPLHRDRHTRAHTMPEHRSPRLRQGGLLPSEWPRW